MRPKTLFTVGGGLLAAGTLAAFGVLTSAVTDAPGLVTSVVTGVAGLLGGVAIARRVPVSTIVRLQDDPQAAVGLFGLPPVGFLVTGAAYWQTGSNTIVWQTLAGPLLAFAGTLTMAHAAERQHVHQLKADAQYLARLPGPHTHIRRQYGRWLAVGAIVTVLGYGYALWTLLDAFNGIMLVISALAPIWTGHRFVRNPEYVVAAEGLVSGVSVTPWDRYEGFELRDDSLVIHRTGSRARQRFPLDAIDDPRAVTRALSEHLRPVSHDW